jgi:hypothetical protein
MHYHFSRSRYRWIGWPRLRFGRRHHHRIDDDDTAGAAAGIRDDSSH